MLENKRFNIVLSLLIAVSLWAYVIGDTNPEDERVFRDIPIQLIGEDTLKDNDLAVLSVSAETMQVTLKGNRANINRIRANDIVATVNLEDAAKGENQLKISIRTPDTVELIDKSLNKVTVEVEERISKEVDIHISYAGVFDNEQEPITIDMSRYNVEVSGAKSLVDQVAWAKASVDEGKVSEELKTISAALTPVDDNGNEVKNVKLSADSIEVTAELAKLKTVNLEVPIVDSGDKLVEKEVKGPKTITLKGKSSDLNEIDKVTAREVDISKVTKDQTISIEPILPKDVQISSKSTDTLYLTIKVKEMASKVFTFDQDDVEIKGLLEGQKAVIEKTPIKITIKGSQAQLADTVDEDFQLSVDLTELKEGAHQVTILATCRKAFGEMKVDPEKIRITIETE